MRDGYRSVGGAAAGLSRPFQIHHIKQILLFSIVATHALTLLNFPRATFL